MPNDFGDWLLGNGSTPGFFGGGVYGVQAQNYNLPGFDQMQQQYQTLGQQAFGMQTPTRQATPEEIAQQIIQNSLRVPSGTINPADVGKFQSQVAMGPAVQDPNSAQSILQQSLLSQLKGSAPSVAQQQLAQTTQGNIANQYAMAAAHGNNPAMARMAATNAANLNQQAAGQGALLRAQEIQNAGSGLMGQFGAQNQAALGFLGQGLQASGMQQQGQMGADQARAQAYSSGAQNSMGGKVLGALGQGLGIAATAGALAYGGEVTPVMGNTKCPGCGRMKVDCVCGGMACGGQVPGYAAGGPINSYQNDTVPAMLSPGEIVLPRSVALSVDAPERAKEFVEAIRAKKRKRAA